MADERHPALPVSDAEREMAVVRLHEAAGEGRKAGRADGPGARLLAHGRRRRAAQAAPRAGREATASFKE